MGGGAKAVGEMADDTMKRRDLELAQQRAEQVAIKGEERRAALQRENAAYEMDLKLKRTEEDGKRYQSQMDKIEGRSTQMGLERDDRTMTAARDKLPQSGEFAGQDITTAEIAALPPAARQAYEQAGMIEKASGSQQLRDQITAAREIGADKPVRDDLRSSYDKQVSSEAASRKEDRADRDATRKEAKDEESARAALVREAEASRRTDALFARISSGGGSGGGGGSGKEGASKFTAAINSAQRVLADTEAKWAKEFREPTFQEKASVEKSEAYAAAKSAYMNTNPELAIQLERLNNLRKREALSLFQDLGETKSDKATPTRPAPAAKDAPKEAPKPTMPALPQGAKAIGTSGGRTVYQTPDGKKYIGN
jgi:hypothetical protein